jgi:cobaltochelatase CobS
MAEQLGALAGDGIPDTQVKVRDVFGLDTDMEAPAFSTPSSHVPLLD